MTVVLAPHPDKAPVPPASVPVARQTPSSAAPRRSLLPVLGRTLILFAALVLGFGGYLFGISDLQEQRSQNLLYGQLRSELRRAVAPVAVPIAERRPIAVLEIPVLGSRTVVVEGTSSGDLTLGPGHRRDTALPGRPGVVVIAGRRSTFGAPFQRLAELRPGHLMTLTTGLGVSTYEVIGRRDSRTPAPAPPGGAHLVLTTGDPAFGATHSLIVSAVLRSAVLPGPAGGVTIRPDERSLHSESAALVPLVLWGQALLLALGVTTWGNVRWRRWPTYLLSTPLLLAILWNAYENLARLLPNTM